MAATIEFIYQNAVEAIFFAPSHDFWIKNDGMKSHFHLNTQD